MHTPAISHRPSEDEKKAWQDGKQKVTIGESTFALWDAFEYTYTLEPSAKPKRMKFMMHHKDKTAVAPAIYELKGDDLRICVGRADGGQLHYPEDFDIQKAKNAGDSPTLVVLKRLDPETNKSDRIVKESDAEVAMAQAAKLKALLDANQSRMDQAEAQKLLVENQLKQLAADRARLEAQRHQLEADLARMKALIDTRDALKKATKGQPNDKALQTLDEIEKLIRQMKKELQDKKGQKE